VIVSCQKGLRSLAAAEQMSRAGYQNLAWINGGLDTAGKDTLPTTNGVDLRYGGVGGVSQVPPLRIPQMHGSTHNRDSCTSGGASHGCFGQMACVHTAAMSMDAMRMIRWP
jgi:hypothetical protein